MKTIAAKTGKAKFYVTAVSTALAGTKHRSTVRKTIGGFGTLGEAREFAETQTRRPEVKNAKGQIRFEIRHDGKVVARMESI